jgi:alpha-L-fucosidase
MREMSISGSNPFCAAILAAALSAGGACRTARPVDHSPEPPSEPAGAAPAQYVPPQERPELEWWRRSMTTRDARLGWWRDARFGMFIHWGVYSHLAGVWQGAPVRGYAEHIQRIHKIPMPVYREKVVAAFHPTAFDADEWVRLAKAVGMGYFVITAKHHDGFAMYDSEVSDYDVVQATPWKRDPMRDLKEACRRHGLRFGFYYSHAFDWGDADGPGNDWDYRNPGGDLLLHGADWWIQAPELLPRIRKYVDGKSIPQLQELIRKYDPDILWFDTAHKLPIEENLRILEAVRRAKPGIVVNGRIAQVVPGGPAARFGDYAVTADRPAELTPHAGDWEAIPTTNESYGYHRLDDSHKTPAQFVQLLAKAAARGGNLLLNIGPMGDGRFDPKDVAILEGVAGWMKTNLESIRGTRRTPLPVQVWGHSTRQGNRLYLHVFDWPKDGKLYVAGLKTDVRAARLLGGTAVVAATRVNPFDVELKVPAVAPDPWDSVIVLDCAEAIVANPAIFVPSTTPLALHVFDGQLVGSSLRYADGKRNRDVVVSWSEAATGIDWPLRLTQPTRMRVAVEFATARPDQGGAFEIAFGTAVLRGTVKPTTGAEQFTRLDLGEVALPAGELTASIRAVEVNGGELMRLRRLDLTPIE